jgi:hypothetical protein
VMLFAHVFLVNLQIVSAALTLRRLDAAPGRVKEAACRYGALRRELLPLQSVNWFRYQRIL